MNSLVSFRCSILPCSLLKSSPFSFTTLSTTFNTAYTFTIPSPSNLSSRWAHYSHLSRHHFNFRFSSSVDHTVAVASPTADEDRAVESAADIVSKFYKGINGRDLVSVECLIAENCIYEDLIFPTPFVGRKDILEFFKKFTRSVGEDLQFVIDNISTEDSSAVGVIWHLEWNGRPFPFSKGCSFYQLEVINGKRQIVYGRDSVEPAIKPGETALVAIRGVTWLLQQFPQLADRL